MRSERESAPRGQGCLPGVLAMRGRGVQLYSDGTVNLHETVRKRRRLEGRCWWRRLRARRYGGGGGVGVGGGVSAGGNRAGVGGADPLNLPRLEHAQQLRLLMHGHVADLVQEDGSTVGQFEAADTIGTGVGERTFHVPEELAFK